MTMSNCLESFRIDISEKVIEDLHRRIDLVRWPVKELVDDWSQGVPLNKMKELVAYWRNKYDWRRCEKQLNSYDQFLTNIDGVDIHFLHIRSRQKDAMPLILTHGWPGSVIEFLKVIGPLTDPESYGGKAMDAFHLVIPSLPGFGFSGHPKDGWKVDRIARAWEELMKRVGYTRYVASGGDIGAAVSSTMGQHAPQELFAVHLSQPFVLPDPPYENLTQDEQAMLDSFEYMARWGGGYALQQASKPQTLGYILADSPVGQAAWIYEKFRDWSDCDGTPENVFTRDEMLDDIMLYWLNNSAASSGRFYWYNWDDGLKGIKINVPTGCSIFPKEIYRAPRTWAERYISNIIYWNEPERGGHFAAFERPEIFVEEIRGCFRLVR